MLTTAEEVMVKITGASLIYTERIADDLDIQTLTRLLKAELYKEIPITVIIAVDQSQQEHTTVQFVEND